MDVEDSSKDKDGSMDESSDGGSLEEIIDEDSEEHDDVPEKPKGDFSFNKLLTLIKSSNSLIAGDNSAVAVVFIAALIC